QKGDVVAVEIKARFLSSCTAIAISDLTIYGCMERAIETPDGFSTYCENSDVTLMAVGTTATKFKWQSSPNNSDWTDLQGVGDGDIISVTATLGNMYYRYVELDGSKKESQVFNLLGQVCCTYLAEQTTVWKETFGNGTGRWQNPNVKNHSFVPGITTKIDDGGYAVVSNSNDACPSCCAWPANKTDHTGDTNGGFLVINVKNVKPPVLIYSQTITPADGFCKSTYYNLSLFASNLSAASNLPSSFMFEVVDAATGNVLGRGETGDVNSFGMESWLNYGTSFAPENSTSVIINIYNTGEAGYGNDVVLDDIAVSVCNAKVDLYAAYPKIDATVQCGEPAVLTAVPDGNMQTFFGTDKPYCLWLKSTDGGSTFSIVNEASGYGNDKYEYTSVEGENATFRVILAKTEDDALKIYRGDPIEECVIYTKTNLASVRCNGCVEPQFVLPATTECSADKQSYTISISVDTGTLTCDCASAKITHTGNDWKFAGIPKDVDVKITATNGNCSSSTTVTAPDCSCPPIDARIESDDTILTCTHTEVVLKALPDDMEYLWSTAETTQSITVNAAGKYTVEVKDALTGCSKVADIDVTEDKEIGAKIESDNTVLTCSHTEVVLKALPDDMEYLWSTAETTQSITVNTAGKYTVEVKETLTGCSGVAMVDVTESITYPKFEVQTPNEVTEPATFFLPDAVISQDCDVMEYYLDQAMTKPVADKTISGVGDYDFYLRGVNNDGCVSEPQMVKVIIKARPVPPPPVPECELEIPVYFSPNGDGLNDEWIIKNIDCYPNAIVEIYDRFNKLLIRCKGSEQKWDGTYNGHPMPMTDYWYIIIDEKLGRRSGHFTLKR
ncbi:MAG: T9SS type B sorting domain-containing protein, partial [Paludibacteraceae bacterium]|nr:T9SS type B sorting domain-containing protein [Paludibacteraceae bacterium]